MNKKIRLAIVFSVGAIIVGCGFLTFFSIKNNSNKTRTIKNNVDVTMTSVHLENGEINPDVFYTDSNNGGTIEISNDYFSLDLEKIEFFGNYIKLSGVDIIPMNYDYEEQHWGTLLDMNEIEYLKIEPMLEKEK